MLSFERNGTKCIARINSGLEATQNVYLFGWDAKDENVAELMQLHLNQAFGDHVRKVGLSEYRRGRREGRLDYIQEKRNETRYRNARKKAKSKK